MPTAEIQIPKPTGMPGIQYFKVGEFRPKPGCHPYFNGADVYTQICEFDTTGGWAVFVYDRNPADGSLVKLPVKEVRFGKVELGPDPNYEEIDGSPGVKAIFGDRTDI